MSCQLTCLWISHLIHDCDPLLKWEGTKQKRADVRRRKQKQMGDQENRNKNGMDEGMDKGPGSGA